MHYSNYFLAKSKKINKNEIYIQKLEKKVFKFIFILKKVCMYTDFITSKTC